MVDVSKLKSHPDKFLFTHINGVYENVKKLTNGLAVSKLAELTAIFHDLGKINPYFQNKIDNNIISEYSHHAYLSAYAFYAFCNNTSNREIIRTFLDDGNVQNQLIASIILIAKHHGHLPDFCPILNFETEPYILNKNEIKILYKFLQNNLENLPIDEFTAKSLIQHGIPIEFKRILGKDMVQNNFINKLIFNPKVTERHLEFFLNVQFSFAVLIQADKSDAMDNQIIVEDKKRIKEFCNIYPATIDKYIFRFNTDTDLNNLRKQIRKESIININNLIQKGKRVFELTAPTGSGKTIMLLSIASEIIKFKGDFRIMYALPYLSITEQVEKETLEIFKEFKPENFIQRIDSKTNSYQFEELQEELDSNPNPLKLKELVLLAFREQVFAYPFVITTFVRFFETLLSNRNATLLKLPNFSKSIFLLDEIQSLPPRLYTFFIAYLTKFCEIFDCYTIISTATQPNFELPNEEKVNFFFNDYKKPASLIEHHKYFSSNIFNRYKIDYWTEPINIEDLAEKILGENNSVLVILNTIVDSRELFKVIQEAKKLSDAELHLLNTHFTPNHREKKIIIIKERLRKNKKTILISTQLIEAGVDIDFPIVYRDFSLISSIVQSAGRCNRNGGLNTLGRVILFNLIKEGKLRANLIYGQGKDKEILHFTKLALGLQTSFQEKELYQIQKGFFDKIAQELHFAKHSQKKFKLEFDFIEDISECAFNKIGKFQLIDEDEYGKQVQYYVPENNNDRNFEQLLELTNEAKKLIQSASKDWHAIKKINFKIQWLFKAMSNQIVSVRLKRKESAPILASSENCNGIYKIDLSSYSFENGIKVSGEESII